MNRRIVCWGRGAKSTAIVLVFSPRLTGLLVAFTILLFMLKLLDRRL